MRTEEARTPAFGSFASSRHRLCTSVQGPPEQIAACETIEPRKRHLNGSKAEIPSPMTESRSGAFHMSNSTAREGRRCAFLFLTIFSFLAAPGLSQRMQAQNAADPTQTEIVEGAAPIPAVPDNVAEAQMIDLPDAPQPVVET